MYFSNSKRCTYGLRSVSDWCNVKCECVVTVLLRLKLKADYIRCTGQHAAAAAEQVAGCRFGPLHKINIRRTGINL